MTDNTTVPSSDNVAPDEFDKASMAGWQWFTKFLLINVVAVIAGLAVVAIFTVWS